MVTVDELRVAAGELGDALSRWAASDYSDDEALQDAVVFHMKLAPVFQAIYGSIPLLTTEYPPYIIVRREQDHLAQAIGALDGGLITQEYLDSVGSARAETPSPDSDTSPHHPQAVLQALIDEGETFSYENFAQKGKHGYPNQLSPEWASWTARVEANVGPRLRPGTSPSNALSEGLSFRYLGYGEDQFLRGRSLILGAITAARDLVVSGEFSPVRELAPVSRRVFVVHGHDEAAKSEVERFLQEQGLEPIVLHRQPDQGMTVIEKFEQYADVGFAVVLLTPDDITFPATADAFEREEGTLRARPNVILEFGYFVGKLGRGRVCCLYTGGVELPSDIAGLLYKQYRESVGEVFYELMKELRAAGYEI